MSRGVLENLPPYLTEEEMAHIEQRAREVLAVSDTVREFLRRPLGEWSNEELIGYLTVVDLEGGAMTEAGEICDRLVAAEYEQRLRKRHG